MMDEMEDDDGQGWAYLLELEELQLEDETPSSNELKETQRHEYCMHDFR